MRVVLSADPLRLEETLVERISSRGSAALDPGNPESGVLVVAPTSLLIRHLKVRIARAIPGGAALGVHFATHAGLARNVLEHAFQVPPRPLPSLALEGVLDSCLQELGDDDAERLRRYSGALRGLLATCRELRDAGIPPSAVSAATTSSATAHPLLSRAYERYVERLERAIADPGFAWADDAALFRRAAPLVSTFLRQKRIGAAIHYGAYELVGFNLELLAEIERHVDTESFVVASRDGRAFEHATRFFDYLPNVSSTASLDDPDDSSPRSRWIRRLSRLYDPGAALDPHAEDSPPALEVRHAQGPETELRCAAMRAIAFARDGSLDDVAIVARNLESYLPFLEGTFEQLDVPFTTTARLPLRRDAAVSSWLGFLRSLRDDLERAAVFSALRDPRLIISTSDVNDAVIDRWERAARRARVHSGIDAWTSILDQLDETRRDITSPLIEIVETLERDRQAWWDIGDLDTHARFLRKLAERRLSRNADGSLPRSVDRLLETLQSIPLSDGALGVGRGAVDVDEALALLERLAEEKFATIGDRQGGVQVLDLMQSRAVTRKATIWIGFHDGLFPRRGRPDPYLPDATRRQLAATTGRPLAVRQSAADEERLLLAMNLASSSERVVISFQRADDRGRKQARSSALREIARMFTGRADVAALLDESGDRPTRVERVPAHPGDRVRSLALSPLVGMATPRDALVAAAVAARRPTEAARATLENLEGLGELPEVPIRTSLDWIDVIESYDVGDGAADGVTSIPHRPERPLYPTRIEHLARCPLSFFLRHVLGTRSLDERVRLDGVDEHLLGRAVHATLERVFQQIAEGGGFDDPSELTAWASEALAPLFREELDRAIGPSGQQLRGVLDILSLRWLEVLERLVAHDIEELAASGVDSIDVEGEVRARVDLGSGVFVEMAGRLDRLWKSGDTLHVDDFKTSGDLAKKLEPANILKGRDLQLPLYRELVATAHGVPSLAVQTRLIGAGPTNEGPPRALKPDGNLREGLLETVAVAMSLLESGRFPFHNDPGNCKYCEFRPTCRRNHEPSAERWTNDPALRDYRDLRRKNSRDGHTLAELRENDAPIASNPEADS